MALTTADSHVVVIGGGLAGLSAANEALKRGAFVTMVEKESLTGNSAKATSGVNAVQSQYQRLMLPESNNPDLFYQDIIKAGHYKNKPELALTLAALSGEAIDTMSHDFDLCLSDIQQLGGHRAKRTHRFPPKDGRVAPVGWTIVSALKKSFLEHVEGGRARLLAPYTVLDFELTERTGPDWVTRPFITSITVANTKDQSITEVLENFSSLILASGGFAADSGANSVVARFRPDLVGFPTTNGPFATGDMLLLAEKKGLSTIDLEYVQVHPTGFIDQKDPLANRKFLCPEVMRGVGGILVNLEGERFVDELLPRDKVTAEIIRAGSSPAEWGLSTEPSAQKLVLMIMDQLTAEKFGIEAFKFYLSKGFIIKVDDLQSMTQVSNVKLEATVNKYNRACSGEESDMFGKSVFPHPINLQEPFYFSYITPALHFTMGGIEIDETARALMSDGRVVSNLFVAGEASGGVHGANRLGGNGCLESAVFGQLSGRLGASCEKIPREAHLVGPVPFRVASATPDGVVNALLPSVTMTLPQKLVLRSPEFELTDRSGAPKGTLKYHEVLPSEKLGLISIKFDLPSEAQLKIYPGDVLIGTF